MPHLVLLAALLACSTAAGAAPASDARTSSDLFTDGFTGAAPDLGALELGAKPPHYGPRN